MRVLFRELQDAWWERLKGIMKYLQKFQDMRKCNGQDHCEDKEAQEDEREKDGKKDSGL